MQLVVGQLIVLDVVLLVVEQLQLVLVELELHLLVVVELVVQRCHLLGCLIVPQR